MANKKILTIDTSKYCTQAQYAKEKGISLNLVSQWVKRAKAGAGSPKIEYLDLPALSITLVKR